jgi:Na+-driven multidrug efflux pump
MLKDCNHPHRFQLAARTSLLTCRVSACIVLVSTVLLGSCTFLARHQVVRVFTEDIHIRAATAVVVPAVATSIVGECRFRCCS